MLDARHGLPHLLHSLQVYLRNQVSHLLFQLPYLQRATVSSEIEYDGPPRINNHGVPVALSLLVVLSRLRRRYHVALVLSTHLFPPFT